MNGEPLLLTLDRTSIGKVSFQKKLKGVYKSAKIVYQEPDHSTTQEFEVESPIQNNSEDVLILNERTESPAQAEAIAREKLRKANQDEWTCDIDIEGDYRFKSGVNLTIQQFGRFDGKWQIQTAEHSFNVNLGGVARLKLQKLN